MNISYDDYQSYDDWGLRLKNITISFPEVKKNEINIPGMDGTLDLSEYLSGDVNYENRTIQYTFDAANRHLENWSEFISKISNCIHGRAMKIVNYFDCNYYYQGRVEFSSTMSSEYTCEVVIMCMVDPYKYDINDGTDPWLWDPFSFKDGIIRNYSDIKISGNTTVKIVGRRKRVVPVILCSAPMKLTYNRLVINLPVGKTKVYELQLGEGEHTVVFSGNGVVSIAYRGGSL